MKTKLSAFIAFDSCNCGLYVDWIWLECYVQPSFAACYVSFEMCGYQNVIRFEQYMQLISGHVESLVKYNKYGTFICSIVSLTF